MKTDLLEILSHMRYVLLPGSYNVLLEQERSVKDLHQNAYRYWRAFWKQVFIDNGDRRELPADDFRRQDIVSVLLFDNAIVGMHLYSLFDVTLDTSKEHSYFSRSFTKVYLRYLERAKIKKAMSWEYLTVDPKWRKGRVGISFALVLLGMATKIQSVLDLDAGIAVSRNDVKVTEMCQSYGAKIVVPNFDMHKTPCSLIACSTPDIVRPSDPNVEHFIKILWNNRVDLTEKNLFTEKPGLVLKAAA